MITPTGEAIPRPLPIHTMTKIGSLTAKDGEVFSVFAGADEAVVAQLKAYSLDASDAAIQDNTSDRARFGEGSYEEWYSKDRTPFSLIHDAAGKLAAFVWFGPKPLGRKSLKYLSDDERAKELEQKEDVWHTLVYRSYAPFRGKGIMGEFTRFAIDEYLKLYPGAKLWTGMSASNEASIALSTKLGFQRRDDLFDPEKNWVAMTRE